MRSGYYEYIRASLSTRAVYQKENAALAVCALEVLSRSCPVTRQQVENGLSQAKWEGRMEEVLPGVFIDGAHNEDGMQAFLESVRRTAAVGKGICCFPLWRTKRVEPMAQRIVDSGLFEDVAIARLDSARSLTEEQLDSLWSGRNQVRLYHSPEQAMEALLEKKRPEDEVYAQGACIWPGQLKAYLEKRKQKQQL